MDLLKIAVTIEKQSLVEIEISNLLSNNNQLYLFFVLLSDVFKGRRKQITKKKKTQPINLLVTVEL